MKVSLVAVGIQNSGNLGALARLCENFNLEKLILISPNCEINKEAYDRATNGSNYLDNVLIVNNIKDIKEYVNIIIALSARKSGIDSLARGAVSIQEFTKNLDKYNENIAIVLGREDSGLTNLEVSYCDVLVNIPLISESPVLNISHAASIVLWEIFRDKEYSSISDNNFRLMQRAEKDAALNFLKKILKHSWLTDDKHNTTLNVFKTILSRSMVTNRESSALIGTFRSIYKSFNEGLPPWLQGDTY